MKIFLIILAVLVSIIVILLIAALFIKKDYALEKEITINKPKQAIFDYVVLMKNHKNFNKWMMVDPNMKVDYTGTDGTPGFKLSWDSENKQAGKGVQEIVSVNAGDRINYKITFIKPFDGKADAYISTTENGDDQTKVKWGFSSAMKYPMNAMMLFVDIPKMLGKDLDTSLVNLKKIMEAQ